MGLGSTTLHYLAVQQAVVSMSIHRPENHANLLAYLGKLTAVHLGTIKCQGGLFLGFAQVFSVLTVRKNCQNGLLLKHGYVYYRLWIDTQLCAWAHRQSAYAQLSPLYLLSTLYVTHVINYSRPSTAFPYRKRRKAGRGLGTRLLNSITQLQRKINRKK